MAIAKVMSDGIASTLARERLGLNGHRRVKKRPIADIQQPTQMLRSQPALLPFAASAKSEVGRTYCLRDIVAF